MRWCPNAVVVPDNRIQLERPRLAVAQIIQVAVTPADHVAHDRIDREQRQQDRHQIGGGAERNRWNSDHGARRSGAMSGDGAAYFLAANGHRWFLLFQSGTRKRGLIRPDILTLHLAYETDVLIIGLAPF